MVRKKIKKSDKTTPEADSTGQDNAAEDKTSELKKAEKKSLPVRITKKILKTLLIWIPVSVIVIVCIALIVLKLYMTPDRVEKTASSAFNSMSNGKLSLNVKEFDVYKGFVIENIRIHSGKNFDNRLLASIRKIVFRYDFFSILTGSIHFPEIGIYNPKLYLQEKNGVWNAAALMKPSGTAPEKEKTVEPVQVAKKDKNSRDAVSLPISVDFLLNFILDDLRVYVNGSKFSTSMEGITFKAGIIIPPFKKIPMSVDAVSLLKKMEVILNPDESVKIDYNSPDIKTNPRLILTWKMLFNKDRKNDHSFSSLFKFGTVSTPVKFRKKILAPLNFMVSYDMRYNPGKDLLKINSLGIEFKRKKWLSIGGQIKKISSSPVLDIRMQESLIDLSDITPYYRSITGDKRTRFSGTISLFPLNVSGSLSDIKTAGKIRIKKFVFKNPGLALSIPSLGLDFSGGKKATGINFNTGIRIPHMSYVLKGSPSGDNSFELKTDISANSSFSRIKINDFQVSLASPELRKKALEMNMSANIALSPVMAAQVNIRNISFLKSPLAKMVPEKFRDKIYKIPVEKKINTSLSINFKKGAKQINAKIGMLTKVPDYKINDLRMQINVAHNTITKIINLKRFNISSKAWNMDISAKGMVDIKKPPFSDSNLNLSVKIDYPKMKNVYGPWSLSGLVNMNASVNGDLATGKASGSILMKNFSLKNPGSKLFVKNMDLDFPFEYFFKSKYSGESLLAVKKDTLIDNENFRTEKNFHIESISAKHPARNIPMEYLSGLSASIQFKNNIFQILDLKAYVLDGSMYGRNILFNLADLKKENMEFNVVMDITNIDIGKLDAPDDARKTREAELSVNTNFSGKGFNINRELPWNGYINIYKIGEKLANKLMKGLSTEQGKSKLGKAQLIVDNFMYIKGFNFNLEKGLIYTRVPLKPGILGRIVGVENNEISFDRIPVQEYLRNILKGD